eukprot:PhM_4_TR8407/c4_g2_i5/m.59069
MKTKMRTMKRLWKKAKLWRKKAEPSVAETAVEPSSSSSVDNSAPAEQSEPIPKSEDIEETATSVVQTEVVAEITPPKPKPPKARMFRVSFTQHAFKTQDTSGMFLLSVEGDSTTPNMSIRDHLLKTLAITDPDEIDVFVTSSSDNLILLASDDARDALCSTEPVGMFVEVKLLIHRVQRMVNVLCKFNSHELKLLEEPPKTLSDHEAWSTRIANRCCSELNPNTPVSDWDLWATLPGGTVRTLSDDAVGQYILDCNGPIVELIVQIQRRLVERTFRVRCSASSDQIMSFDVTIPTSAVYDCAPDAIQARCMDAFGILNPEEADVEFLMHDGSMIDVHDEKVRYYLTSGNTSVVPVVCRVVLRSGGAPESRPRMQVRLEYKKKTMTLMVSAPTSKEPEAVRQWTSWLADRCCRAVHASNESERVTLEARAVLPGGLMKLLSDAATIRHVQTMSGVSGLRVVLHEVRHSAETPPICFRMTCTHVDGTEACIEIGGAASFEEWCPLVVAYCMRAHNIRVPGKFDLYIHVDMGVTAPLESEAVHAYVSQLDVSEGPVPLKGFFVAADLPSTRSPSWLTTALSQISDPAERGIWILQNTWKQIQEREEDAIRIFFDSLMDIRADIRGFFSNHAVPTKQVFQMIDFCVQNIRDSDELHVQLRVLGQRHVQFGVLDTTYFDACAPAFRCVVDALLEPQDITEELYTSWNTLFDVISENIVSGYRSVPSIGLTPSEIETVQTTWDLIRDPTTALFFYDELFSLQPELKNMFFRGADIASQGHQLFFMLDTLVGLLSNGAKMVPTLHTLGQRHANYGVLEPHYELAGLALMATLKKGLAGAFTTEVQTIWSKFWVAVQATMIGGGVASLPFAKTPSAALSESDTNQAAAADDQQQQQQASGSLSIHDVLHSCGLNESKIELIKSSWALVRPVGVDMTRLFFDELFVHVPESRDKFQNSDLTSMQLKFFGLLDSAVGHLGDEPRLLVTLNSVNTTHARFGVTLSHFESAGKAFLNTLRTVLASEFTPEVEIAWQSFWIVISHAMTANSEDVSQNLHSMTLSFSEETADTVVLQKSWTSYRRNVSFRDVVDTVVKSLTSLQQDSSNPRTITFLAEATVLLMDDVVKLLGSGPVMNRMLLDAGKRHASTGIARDDIASYGSALTSNLLQFVSHDISAERFESIWTTFFATVKQQMQAGFDAAEQENVKVLAGSLSDRGHNGRLRLFLTSRLLSDSTYFIIRVTWFEGRKLGTDVVKLFYTELFRAYPILRDTLFRKTDFEKQSKHFFTTLAIIVGMLENFDLLSAFLRKLGARHVSYGVQAAHYEAAASALLSTLRKGLGSMFTPTVEVVWATALNVVVGEMMAGGTDSAAQTPVLASYAAAIDASWEAIKLRHQDDLKEHFTTIVLSQEPSASAESISDSFGKLMELMSACVALLSDREMLRVTSRSLIEQHARSGMSDVRITAITKAVQAVVMKSKLGLSDEIRSAWGVVIYTVQDAIHGMLNGARSFAPCPAGTVKSLKSLWSLCDRQTLKEEFLRQVANPDDSDKQRNAQWGDADSYSASDMFELFASSIQTVAFDHEFVGMFYQAALQLVNANVCFELYRMALDAMQRALCVVAGQDKWTEEMNETWDKARELMQECYFHATAESKQLSKRLDTAPTVAEIVQLMWEHVRRCPSPAAIFYEELYTTRPSLAMLLRKTRFFSVIDCAVALLGSPAKMQSLLHTYGTRDTLLGVQNWHYILAGRAMSNMLTRILGADETRMRAWKVTYKGIVMALLQGVRDGSAKQNIPRRASAVYLVQKSWARVRDAGDAASMLFYSELFSIDPQLRATLFRETNIERQSKSLMDMLDNIVHLLSRTDGGLLPALRELAVRHSRYGVNESHYGVVGQALMSMLRKTLGAEFSIATGEAWCAFWNYVCLAFREALKSDGKDSDIFLSDVPRMFSKYFLHFFPMYIRQFSLKKLTTYEGAFRHILLSSCTCGHCVIVIDALGWFSFATMFESISNHQFLSSHAMVVRMCLDCVIRAFAGTLNLIQGVEVDVAEIRKRCITANVTHDTEYVLFTHETPKMPTTAQIGLVRRSWWQFNGEDEARAAMMAVSRRFAREEDHDECASILHKIFSDLISSRGDVLSWCLSPTLLVDAALQNSFLWSLSIPESSFYQALATVGFHSKSTAVADAWRTTIELFIRVNPILGGYLFHRLPTPELLWSSLQMMNFVLFLPSTTLAHRLLRRTITKGMSITTQDASNTLLWLQAAVEKIIMRSIVFHGVSPASIPQMMRDMLRVVNSAYTNHDQLNASMIVVQTACTTIGVLLQPMSLSVELVNAVQKLVVRPNALQLLEPPKPKIALFSTKVLLNTIQVIAQELNGPKLIHTLSVCLCHNAILGYSWDELAGLVDVVHTMIRTGLENEFPDIARRHSDGVKSFFTFVKRIIYVVSKERPRSLHSAFKELSPDKYTFITSEFMSTLTHLYPQGQEVLSQEDALLKCYNLCIVLIRWCCDSPQADVRTILRFLVFSGLYGCVPVEIVFTAFYLTVSRFVRGLQNDDTLMHLALRLKRLAMLCNSQTLSREQFQLLHKVWTFSICTHSASMFDRIYYRTPTWKLRRLISILADFVSITNADKLSTWRRYAILHLKLGVSSLDYIFIASAVLRDLPPNETALLHAWTNFIVFVINELYAARSIEVTDMDTVQRISRNLQASQSHGIITDMTQRLVTTNHFESMCQSEDSATTAKSAFRSQETISETVNFILSCGCSTAQQDPRKFFCWNAMVGLRSSDMVAYMEPLDAALRTLYREQYYGFAREHFLQFVAWLLPTTFHRLECDVDRELMPVLTSICNDVFEKHVSLFIANVQKLDSQIDSAIISIFAKVALKMLPLLGNRRRAFHAARLEIWQLHGRGISARHFTVLGRGIIQTMRLLSSDMSKWATVEAEGTELGDVEVIVAQLYIFVREVIGYLDHPQPLSKADLVAFTKLWKTTYNDSIDRFTSTSNRQEYHVRVSLYSLFEMISHKVTHGTEPLVSGEDLPSSMWATTNLSSLCENNSVLVEDIAMTRRVLMKGILIDMMKTCDDPTAQAAFIRISRLLLRDLMRSAILLDASDRAQLVPHKLSPEVANQFVRLSHEIFSSADGKRVPSPAHIVRRMIPQRSQFMQWKYELLYFSYALLLCMSSLVKEISHYPYFSAEVMRNFNSALQRLPYESHGTVISGFCTAFCENMNEEDAKVVRELVDRLHGAAMQLTRAADIENERPHFFRTRTTLVAESMSRISLDEFTDALIDAFCTETDVKDVPPVAASVKDFLQDLAFAVLSPTKNVVDIVPSLQATALRFVRMGFEAVHIDAFASCLLTTLQYFVGSSDWVGELRAAWMLLVAQVIQTIFFACESIIPNFRTISQTFPAAEVELCVWHWKHIQGQKSLFSRMVTKIYTNVVSSQDFLDKKGFITQFIDFLHAWLGPDHEGDPECVDVLAQNIVSDSVGQDILQPVARAYFATLNNSNCPGHRIYTASVSRAWEKTYWYVIHRVLRATSDKSSGRTSGRLSTSLARSIMPPEISWDDIALHNTPKDCWVVLQNIAYDLTSFLPIHPGGTALIAKWAGKDITASFLSQHNNSSLAWQTLPQYRVGIAPLPRFSWEDISRHDTTASCWIVIAGIVCDVTAWLDQHPGGREVVLSHAGKDATMAFFGHDHTDSAMSLIQQFAIGRTENALL